MDVYYCRDISVGEELTITYVDSDILDRGVDIRRLTFALGWGGVCDCSRCHKEQPEPPNASELIRRRVEWESPQIDWVNNSLARFTDAVCAERNFTAQARLVLSLMTQVSFKWRDQGPREQYTLYTLYTLRDLCFELVLNVFSIISTNGNDSE